MSTQPSRIPKIAREVSGCLLIIAALLLAISLISFVPGNRSANWLGMIGHAVGGILEFSFGLGGYLVCTCVGWIGWRMLRGKQLLKASHIAVYFGALLSSVCLLLTVIADSYPGIGASLASWIYTDRITHYSPIAYRELRFHLGGLPFSYLYRGIPGGNLSNLLSPFGTVLLSIGCGLTASVLLFEVQLAEIGKKIMRRRPKKVKVKAPPKPELFEVEVAPLALEAPKPTGPTTATVRRKTTPPKRAQAIAAQRVYNGDFRSYKLPPLSLLTPAKRVDQTTLKANLKGYARTLEKTLESFGIEAKVGDISCGPTITSFEVHPPVGVKVQKIKALENDIALNMKARSIRILAPIPGKGAVGVEIPNPKPQEVGLREMLEAYAKSNVGHQLPVLLGKAVNGDDVIADLAKMPHAIIAGATGSGKSVCLNSIIMSLLMRSRPDEVRLLMVDPKKVELTGYSPLPHMIAPVITEPGEACVALNWLVKEMERRYELLKIAGVRNIVAFNERKRDITLEESLDREVPERLGYIVAIIDELADLMMVSSSDIETPITRIAQMARAVGIHLILATQRPSREVITGLIKANFPTRIGFKVSSRINSQIILDEPGAETLLGNGDMLFLPPGAAHLIRAQGAYIRDEDINKTIEFICAQAPTNYLIESFAGGPQLTDDDTEGLDPLYKQAYDIVVSTRVASTTFIQRKLKIGYARAASIMDQLEDQNVIGPSEGAKARQILVK